jgi:hypothetical protein
VSASTSTGVARRRSVGDLPAPEELADALRDPLAHGRDLLQGLLSALYEERRERALVGCHGEGRLLVRPWLEGDALHLEKERQLAQQLGDLRVVSLSVSCAQSPASAPGEDDRRDVAIRAG